MTYDSINRSTINKADFMRVYKLANMHSWLLKRDKALLDLWTMLDAEEYKKLIESLIHNFVYITSSDHEEASEKIASIITEVWNLNFNKTFVVAISEDTSPDGSEVILQGLKDKFPTGWKDKNFINSLGVAMHNAVNNSTLVLVDDFIGTGKTIKRRVQAVRNYLSTKGVSTTIKVISLAAMEASKEILDTIDVEYESVYWLKKGISDNYSGEQLKQATELMQRAESLLGTKAKKMQLKHFRFGYGESEALFRFEPYNIPNNVFPIFWWNKYNNGEDRLTLFKRSK